MPKPVITFPAFWDPEKPQQLSGFWSKNKLIIELQDQLIGKFKALFPEKLHCLSGKYLAPYLLDIDFSKSGTKNNQFIFGSISNLTDKNFEEKHFQFGINALFDTAKLANFFHKNPSIVRTKGHLQTENGWKLVNFTLSGCIFETCLPKNQGELVIIVEKSADHPFPDFQGNMKKLLI